MYQKGNEMAITAEIIDVTPAMAREFLSHNRQNRNLTQRNVNKYSADMKSGNWEITGETIVFYENGDLKDGQHRLTAILKANVSVPMIVVRGIDNNVKIHDQGRKRTTSDVLALEGYEAAIKNKCTVGAVNFLLKEYGGIRDTTYPQVKGFSDRHAETIIMSLSAVRYGSNHALCKKSSIQAAAFCELYNGVPIEDVNRFFEVANSGFCASEKESAAIVLRNFLLSPAKYDGKISTGAGGQYQQKRYFEVCIRAITDFAAGRPRKLFYTSRTETQHEKYLKENAFKEA